MRVDGGAQMYCWGDNRAGEFGNGTQTSSSSPALVTTAQSFKALTAGFLFTCGLTDDGSAFCWGRNGEGALGDNTRTSRLTPIAVKGGLHFQSLYALYGHGTCGIATTGATYCWGSNGTGRLGDGTTLDHLTPEPVTGGHAFTQIMGGNGHTCGLTTEGAVFCWGDNSSGQLGDGTETSRLVPTLVGGNIAFQSLGFGSPDFFSCGVAIDGAAYCWGDDAAFELGIGFTADGAVATCSGVDFSVNCEPLPQRVFGTHHFVQISLNLYDACALTLDEGAYCWGDNSVGQNGDGFSGNLEPNPALVAPLSSP